MQFTALVSAFSAQENLWESHLPIPNNVYEAMKKIAPDKRVKCTLNHRIIHYCAMMPKGDFHYLLLNKELTKKLKLSLGDEVTVDIEKNDLEYGVPICEEFKEVLLSDVEGSEYFHHLTLGKQRSLIHVINKYKSSELRIRRGILILQHLIENHGKIDFKVVLERFKEDK